MNMRSKTGLAAAVVSAMTLAAQATIRYCAPEPTGDDSNDGLSELTPKTFSGAVAKLANGDELRVLKGTYRFASGDVGGHRFNFGGPLSFRGWDKDKNAPADREDVVIDLEGKNGLFRSVRGLEVCNLTVQNAHARTYGGGAICLPQNTSYSDEEVIVSNCVFKSNYAYVHTGGAIYAYRPATIVDCLFEGNTNDTDGGALSLSQGAVARGCTFIGNSSKGMGGALYGDASSIVSDCVFSNNVAKGNGGAIYGVKSVYDSFVISNRTENCGGGFAWAGTDVRTLVHCFISNNVQMANSNWACGGGGLFLDNTKYGRLSLTNCVVSHNWSAVNGGAVLMRYASLFEAFGCTFEGNFADCECEQNCAGSVLWFLDPMAGSTNRFEGCTFRNNRWRLITKLAQLMGGVVYSSAANAIVKGCTFENESGDASYIFNFKGSDFSSVEDCTFASITNSRTGVSYGIASVSSPCAVRNCVFRNNDAEDCGLATGGSATTTNLYQSCTFADNYSRKNSLVSASGAFLRVEDCTFTDNILNDGYSSTGGGICISAGGKAAIDRCSFVNNTNSCYTGASGGAISLYSTSAPDPASHVRNCLFDGNACGWHANRFASAIFLYSGGSSAIPIENCTFVNNLKKAPVQCASNVSWSEKNLINCVFAGNEYNQGTGNMDNCWQGTLADAKFADAAHGDYRPAKDSPLVDQGLNAAWMTGARDLQNLRRVPRIVNDIVDIGSYEYRPLQGIAVLVR